MINWQCIPFCQLTTQQLYELLKLRVDVLWSSRPALPGIG